MVSLQIFWQNFYNNVLTFALAFLFDLFAMATELLKNEKRILSEAVLCIYFKGIVKKVYSLPQHCEVFLLRNKLSWLFTQVSECGPLAFVSKFTCLHDEIQVVSWNWEIIFKLILTELYFHKSLKWKKKSKTVVNVGFNKFTLLKYVII